MRVDTKGFKVRVERNDGTASHLAIVYQLVPADPHVVTEIYRLVWSTDDASPKSAFAKELFATNLGARISTDGRSNDVARIEGLLKEAYGAACKDLIDPWV